MQNVSHHLRLLCAPTWPSYDVIGEHLLINKSAMLHTINHRQGIRGISVFSPSNTIAKSTASSNLPSNPTDFQKGIYKLQKGQYP